MEYREDDPRPTPGRGPGRPGHWYEVRLYGGERFFGRFREADNLDAPKVDHELIFDLDGDGGVRTGTRRVRYGDLSAAVPMRRDLRQRATQKHRERVRRKKYGTDADEYDLD